MFNHGLRSPNQKVTAIVFFFYNKTKVNYPVPRNVKLYKKSATQNKTKADLQGVQYETEKGDKRQTGVPGTFQHRHQLPASSSGQVVHQPESKVQLRSRFWWHSEF